ncbi:MAG: type IV pilus assembly protein PilM [bacterium]
MGLFGGKKRGCLGIDFGSGGIKLVELKGEKGRPRLVTYAFGERLPGSEPANLIDDPEGTAALLRKMLKKARTTTVRAVGGLPVASVFSSVVTVPKAAKPSETLEAARGQARKLIPVPLDDMSLDIKIVDGPARAVPVRAEGVEPGRPPREMAQVLITGASNSMIKKYVDVFKRAGLELASLETETLALIRSLVGKDKSPTVIVDMGAVRTNIIIVDGGIPYVTRSVDMGGVALTRTISRTLGLDLNAAEEMKSEIKNAGLPGTETGLPKLFEPAMAPLVTEIQYSISMYAGQNGDADRPIEKIILTGGTAGMSMLTEYFSRQLKIRTYIGDPWARVAYPEGLRSALDEIGSRFAVVVGLAMQQIDH